MSAQPRTPDGQFARQVDDSELAAYVRRKSRVSTTEITTRFELPRTTAWSALDRLEARGEVAGTRLGTGKTAMWAPGPIYSLCGPKFANLRPESVTLQDASDHLTEKLDGDTASPATISRFENGQAELDARQRRVLYKLYEEES